MLKRMLKLFFILIISIQPFLISTVNAQGENIVKNPGFEEGDTHSPNFWYTHSWNKEEGRSEFFLDETQFHTGNRSACIINNKDNDSRYKQNIKVKGNTYYRISCWVKTENVKSNIKGANLSLEGSTDTSRDVRGTSSNWEYIELYGKSSPNQESFTLTVGLGGHGNINTGKAWFDDIEVVELDTLPPGKTAINLDPNHTSSDSNDKTSGNNTNNSYIIFVSVLFIAAILAFIFFMLFKNKIPGLKTKFRNDTSNEPGNMNNRSSGWIKVKFDRTDFIIMGIMTLIYLCIALYNLGDLKVPTTSWEPTMTGESFTIDLGKDAELSRIYYYCGLGSTKKINSKLRVEYLDETQNFKHLAAIEKEDIFIWKYIDTAPVKTRQLRFLVDAPGGSINEIAIVEQGSTEPIKNISIIDRHMEGKGELENLFDEQEKFAFRPSYMNGMYFDEIYHARAAFEYVHQMTPSEVTHPPLGKLFLAIGILIFGMVPFGWRIIGTLFGVAMVPVMYAFGKKIFHDRFYAFCSAFLMMFDFMHFSQTRIATIDSYVTLFVMLMYYYMYDYFINKSYLVEFKESLKPLFLCGLFFGLGASSKWIAFYGSVGLALLFLVNKAAEFIEYRKLSKKKALKGSWVEKYPRNLTVTIGAVVLFLAIIPAIIYILSYIPWMLTPNNKSGIGIFWKNSLDMLNFHSGLESTHPYQSAWWEWPVMVKPMAFYFGKDLEPGMVSKIFTMGNPAVWWIGLLALLIVSIWALSKLNKNLVVLFTLTVFSFGYIALPKTIMSNIFKNINASLWQLCEKISAPGFITNIFKSGNTEFWWGVIFFVLIAIILFCSKIDTSLIITSFVSSAGYVGILTAYRNVVRDDNYLKDKNIQMVIWICLLVSIVLLLISIYRYDKKLLVVLSGLIFQYIPWIAVPRIAFIYHYFSIVPFIILLIVYVIKKAVDKYKGAKYFAYVYLGIVLALFILFYPGISGLEVPVSYMRALKWFSTWYF